MNTSNFHSDDRAVSPVIGTMLMLLIGVILTASIGPFVFGLSTNVDGSSPDTQFDFEFTDAPSEHDTLVITYTGREVLSGENLNVTVTEATNKSGASVRHAANDFPYPKVEGSDTNAVDAGDFHSTGISDSGAEGELDLNGATVSVVWKSPETGRTDVLATWTGPDA